MTARQMGEIIELDFPASIVEPVDEPMELAEALGVTPKYHGKSESFHLLELETERAVRRITPEIEKLRALPVRATSVTSKAEAKEYDFELIPERHKLTEFLFGQNSPLLNSLP